MADDLDYSAPRWLNPDFARLMRNGMIAKSRAGAVSVSDMERLERASRTVVGDSSQSYWLLSSLLSQLKQDGYKLSEPSLFDKTISSLSASMTLQTSLVSRITDFVVSKRNLSLVMSKFLSPLCRRGNCWFRPGLGIFYSTRLYWRRQRVRSRRTPSFPLWYPCLVSLNWG